ncbi:hypothetical protein BaRGS_00029441 [Batillaria attramentaria]|uniref:Uncharacterized protein n=1 Tax=Batillaria attramentaria TaxID=370345 RepID=A0ABD0JWU0_9CAEN
MIPPHDLSVTRTCVNSAAPLIGTQGTARGVTEGSGGGGRGRRWQSGLNEGGGEGAGEREGGVGLKRGYTETETKRKATKEGRSQIDCVFLGINFFVNEHAIRN